MFPTQNDVCAFCGTDIASPDRYRLSAQYELRRAKWSSDGFAMYCCKTCEENVISILKKFAKYGAYADSK